MKKEEFYYIRWKCYNCGNGYPYEDDMKVPKGETIKDFSKRTECPICGCKGTIYESGGAFLRYEDENKRIVKTQLN